MPTTQTELEPGNGTNSDVIRWRRVVLVRAGYDEESAMELAHMSEVDLHRAVDLVRAGCPPKLAYRIFA